MRTLVGLLFTDACDDNLSRTVMHDTYRLRRLQCRLLAGIVSLIARLLPTRSRDIWRLSLWLIGTVRAEPETVISRA